MDYDKPFPCSHIKEFCNNRNLTFETIENVNQRLSGRSHRDTKIANLYINRFFLEKANIYGEDHSLHIQDLNSKDVKTSEDYRKAYFKRLDNFIIEKNYNGEYVMSERQQIAMNLLQSPDDFDVLLDKLVKTFNKRSIEKYGVKGSKKWRDMFKERSGNYLGQLASIFVNDEIYIPKNYVANRDYNILVNIGMEEINLIANYFNVTVTEIDIVTCYPRIIYAINGMQVPDDFYGENKKNKVGMNALLNSLLYDLDSKIE